MITTVYNKEVIKVYADKVSKTKVFKLIFITGIFLICLGILSMVVFICEKEQDPITYVFNAIEILLGVFFACYKYFYKLILTSNKKFLNVKEEYEFNENDFNVISYDSTGNNTLQATINYSNIISLEIFEGYLFLYLNKQSAIMINEKEFRSLENANNILINIQQNIQLKNKK